MKKYFLTFIAASLLAACSASNEERQIANDSYEKHADMPNFAPLATGGLTILGQNNTYQLPTTQVTKGAAVDIRPPSVPASLIGQSVAQFDGERASIVYPAAKKEVYNLRQIERLLSEDGVKFTAKNNMVETDWAKSIRNDDVGNVQLRYRIEEFGNQEANALTVSILEAKRDNVIFTPTVTDKQRYTSDYLNRFVGKLKTAYQTQQKQVETSSTAPIQTAIVTDTNGHVALGLTSDFNQSWQKLATALPALGFEISEENAGRGYRLLNYKPLDDSEWLRFGVTKPELEKGEYSMQLSAYGKQSAVVISDEDKEALSSNNAQAVYQALQALLTK